MRGGYAFPHSINAMNKIAIPILFLLYVLYLISDYFLGRASPEGARIEFLHFAVFVLVAGLSFFKWGISRFLLLFPYVVLAWRCLEAVPVAYAENDNVFLFSCLLALLLILVISIGIIFNRGEKLPKTKLMRINIFLWALVLSTSSRMLVFVSFAGNLIFIISLFCYVALFISFLYISIKRRWLFFVQLCFLVVVSIPYLINFPNDFISLFSKEYVLLTLLVYLVTFVLFIYTLKYKSKRSTFQIES